MAPPDRDRDRDRDGEEGAAGEALRRLGEALDCDRCRGLLRKPVSLGNCPHVFCLACVGVWVGSGCPVCHIPSLVRDVKVNRPLDNVARLYRHLRRGRRRRRRHQGEEEEEADSGTDTSSPWEAVADRGKNRQIKMWFSPRSGKMRFQHLRKRPEKAEQAAADQEGPQPLAPTPSAHGFLSPSQEPFREAKKAPPKCKKRLRKGTSTCLD